MTNYTPIPWEVIQSVSSNKLGVRSKSGFICWLSDVTRWKDQEQRYIDETQERLANANLIAASPDMYEALKSLEPMFDSYIAKMLGGRIPGWQDVDHRFNKARASLIKAKGV